ncbi:sigma-70 family RNA polymerase sigma factor [Gemmata sp. G18]|uniref:Sigma-70 family RNA polymerase sigma factor n=1 Tax=Gemmata palustris TaxID=2822762 RepID=A0ABS5BKE9_9BACT|nr:sigma-70 family RNA polymerase sigma factor [Gemmata palustris]MBP3954164.1 sigma-70 family RNA polymerase sigma factor [Gemmata palustris]
MSGTISKTVTEWITRLTASSPEAEAELLHRYATTGDQEAFAALTERFAPLVWGVCSRSLRHSQDAEDAFQATFLALAKQADGLTGRGPLAPWLHQVARRSAALVYRQNQRRREVSVGETPAVAAPVIADPELVTALDEEIGRLPEKYRRPVVLCHLQQQTYAEAAKALGCSVPTICRRVTQGCELLRDRLSRRGLVPAAGLAVLFTAMVQPVSAMPPGLVTRTVQAVTSGFVGGSSVVADTVIASMRWGRTVKYVAVLSAIALAGAVGAGLTARATVPNAVSPAIEAPVVTLNPIGPRLDRLGDPLPDGAVARIGTLRMRGEGGGAGDVVFLPGGRTVASVHGRSVVSIWDIDTGKELHRLAAPVRSHQLSLNPDGRILAVCGTDEVRLLNVTNPAATTMLWSWAPKAGTGWRVRCVAFAPDGRTVAVGDAVSKVVRLFDTATGRELQALAGSVVHGLAFSPDGKVLGGLGEGRVTNGVGDGYRLLLWDLVAGLPQKTPSAATGPIRRFAFVGSSVVVTDARGARQARLIDLGTGRETGHWTDRGLHSILAPTPDGTALAELAGGKVTVRDSVTGNAVRASGAISELAIVDRQADIFGWRFSRDGRFFAAVARGGQVWVWDVVTGLQAGPHGRIHGAVQSLAFSPDGGTLTTLHGTAGRSWAVGSGVPAAPLAGNDEGEVAAREVVFPDATGPTVIQFPTPADRTLRATTWDVGSGVAADRVPIPADVWQTGAANGAASPDGRWIAWGTPTVVTLVNRATGQEARRLIPAHANPAALQFSADGGTLLRLPFGKNAVEVWGTETGTHRGTLALLPRYRSNSAHVVKLSADGQWLASTGKHADGSQALTVTEVDTGKGYRLPTLTGAGSLHALAFSPNGRLLAAAAEDGSLRVWDLASGKELRAYRGHKGRALAVLFSPDGTRIASGGFDGTGLIWIAPTPTDVHTTRSADEVWRDLASADPAAAHRATFEAAVSEMVPVIAQRLRTEPGSSAARAVVALERIGSPAAKTVLEELAARTDGNTPSRDAAAALRRLLMR